MSPRPLPPAPRPPRTRLLALVLTAALPACGSDPAAPPPPTALGEGARTYLTHALDIMESRSLVRLRMDWPTLRANAVARAGAAQTPAETYPAIEAALAALGDGHSRFFPPTRGPAQAVPEPAPSPLTIVTGRLLDDRVAYVNVPGYGGANGVGRADSTQALVRALDGDAAAPCGWIVDLRRNGGGNMWPMVAGLGPLLGDGVAGHFVEADGWAQPWFHVAGGAGIGAPDARPLVAATSPYRLRDPSAPVAVLHGPRTASSGEATAIAFRGRPDARSFGAPTRGLSTANLGFRLADGAILNLTVSTMADRDGTLFGGPLEPDEPVAGPAEPQPGAVDAVVAAASAWLLAHAACAAPRAG